MNTLTKLSSATELAESLANANPDRRFATSKSGFVVGVWSEEAGRYIGCASLAITDQWVLTPEGLPMMNGKPAVADEDWIPISAAMSSWTVCWTTDVRINSETHSQGGSGAMQSKVVAASKEAAVQVFLTDWQWCKQPTILAVHKGDCQ